VSTTVELRETTMIRSLLNGALRNGAAGRPTGRGYGQPRSARGGAGAAIGASVGSALLRRLSRGR
jgi:hypothetical protein